MHKPTTLTHQLESMHLFDTHQISALIQVGITRHIRKGQTICQNGDKLRALYILLTGQAVVYVRKSPEQLQRELQEHPHVEIKMIDKTAHLKQLYQHSNHLFGMAIGDIEHCAILFNQNYQMCYTYEYKIMGGTIVGLKSLQYQRDKHIETIISCEDCHVLEIKRAEYIDIMNIDLDVPKRKFEYIKNQIFPQMTNEGLLKIIPEFRELKGRNGQLLYKVGDEIQLTYLLIQGEVQILRKDSANKLIVAATLSAGEYFGDEELILDQSNRQFTAKCISNCEFYVVESDKLVGFMKGKDQFKHLEDRCLAKMAWRINKKSIRTIQRQDSNIQMYQNRLRLPVIQLRQRQQVDLYDPIKKNTQQESGVSQREQSDSVTVRKTSLLLNQSNEQQIYDQIQRNRKYEQDHNTSMMSNHSLIMDLPEVPEQKSARVLQYLTICPTKRIQSITELQRYSRLRGINVDQIANKQLQKTNSVMIYKKIGNPQLRKSDLIYYK